MKLVNYDLQMMQGQLGDPEKKSYWDNKSSYTDKFEMLDVNIFIKSVWRKVPEVHEVPEVQEIPNQIKSTSWVLVGSMYICIYAHSYIQSYL